MDGIAEKYINPLTDFGFKKLFGEETSKDLLIDFLNELLPEKHKIEELTYGKNEFMGDTQIDRRAVFDLYCQSSTGEHFIVEIQKARQNYFKDRSVFYASFPIREQGVKGNWDFKLDAVYTIGILGFKFADPTTDENELFHRIQLKDQNCKVFYDKLSFLYIELPKFKKELHELSSKFEKWLYLFGHLHYLNERPIELQERVFEKLFKLAEIAKFSPDERQAYQQSLKHYWDLNNVINTAAQESKMEGKIEGKMEGKIEMVKIGLEEGLSAELLCKMSGLSVEEIIRIKKEL